MSACPICKYELLKDLQNDNSTGALVYSCPRCGDYVVSRIAGAYLSEFVQDRSKAMALSHWIRKHGKKESLFVFKRGDFMDDESLKLPDPFEQARNFVRFMGENCPVGEYLALRDNEHGGIVGAASEEGFDYIASSLVHDKILEPKAIVHAPNSSSVRLSFAGWERFNDIKRGNIQSTRAFMAMPFKYDDLNKLFEAYFRPAVKATGFSLVRLDDEPHPGLIDERLMVEIQNCRFLIADVTHGNLGAYWEAGYAEGMGKRVIYTCDEARMKDAHFDTNHRQTIVWNEGKMEPFVDKLKASIRLAIPEATRED